MAKLDRNFINKKIEQADSVKKVNPLDLSSDQDLTIGLMNLIAIEDMVAPDSELYRTISDIRMRLMSCIVSTESPRFDLSLQLLSQSIRLIESAHGLDKRAAYDAYDAAYGVYSLFWGLNTGLFDADTIKKLQQDIIKY